MLSHNTLRPTQKYRIYRYLEKPTGKRHAVYQLSVFVFVLFNFFLSNFINHDNLNPKLGSFNAQCNVLFVFDVTLTSLLLVEFILRVWSLDVNPSYRGPNGRLVYMCNWRLWLDVVILGASFLLAFGTCFGSLSSADDLRFLQILRIFHVDRQALSWHLIRRVFALHRVELLASLYLIILGVLFVASVVYNSENDISFDNKTFSSFGQALYWGVVTFSTVGYGDIAVNSWWAKLITALACFVLVALTSIPASVLGVGLACMVQDDELKKLQTKQRPLAATVIQCWWRSRMIKAHRSSRPSFHWAMLRKLIAHQLASQRSRYRRSSLIDSVRARMVTITSLNSAVWAKRRLKRCIVGDQMEMSLESKPSSNGDLSLEAAFTDAETSNQQSYNSIPAYYRLTLSAVWLWRFYAAKRKFKKTRQYCDLSDVSQQLSESEAIQLQEMNKLLSRFEMAIGKTAQEADLLSRLFTVETKILHMTNSARNIEQIATTLKQTLQKKF
ncbi:Potassium voltage-gated channel subfamily KQT member 1 [Trichinella zimbabwensis]|uniref:Potassium voltage-gated channel subfamily KQT member 1 n=1 Tax=Trichinella zimbabwensis TaxID=268475 RepID=A0A0V1HGZ2_9BILA|nr:Potassium voltage-gated channel subfamily KQT member 1 [Trichinella zimbabwensis]